MNKRRILIFLMIGAASIGTSAAISAGPDINHGRQVATGEFAKQQAGLACVNCHGLNGAGNSSGAFPRLSDQSAWYLYKTLKDFAAGLRPNDVMQAVAHALTDAQMADVAAYYASVDDAPYPPVPEANEQAVQIGGAIAAVGIPDRGVPACNTCHGQSGVGAPPIYPYLAGQFAPYIEHQMMLWKEGRRDGDPMNIMESIAKNMTNDQIRAVSLYFASLRPREVTPDEDSYLTLDDADGQGTAGSRTPYQPEFVPAERVDEDQAGGQQPEENQAVGTGQTGSHGGQDETGDSPAGSTTENGDQQDSVGQQSGSQSGGGGSQ